MIKQFTQQITLDEMAKEVSRELVTRLRVYPRWIADGKISQSLADERVLIMKAILIHLQSEIKRVSPQKELFDGQK